MFFSREWKSLFKVIMRKGVRVMEIYIFRQYFRLSSNNIATRFFMCIITTKLSIAQFIYDT